MGKMIKKSMTFFIRGSFAMLICASAVRGEQVTVETLDCNGSVGFGSFDDRRLHKILEGGCENPGNPGENLQQILLRSKYGQTTDQILWVTRDEARNVMAQIQANKAVRQEYLKKRNQVNVTVDPGKAAPGGSENSNVPEASAQ